MDKNNKVFLSILTLVAIYLAIVISIPILRAPRNSTVTLPGNSISRTITISSSASVKLKPDTAVLSLGIQTISSTVKAASDENSKIAAKVLEALKKAGVLDADIQTSNFNIAQNYDSVLQKNSGYVVTNSLTVSCPLAKASLIAQTAVDNGANQFSGLAYEIEKTKREAAQTDLINTSLKAAMAKAEKIVAGTSVKVGKAISINPSYGYNPYVYRMDAAVAKTSSVAAQVPIEAGLTEVTASVEVVFELIP